jgi:hypothetical protein
VRAFKEALQLCPLAFSTLSEEERRALLTTAN